MTKLEIVQSAANIHNRLAQIMVSGDNAIQMGSALVELRSLVKVLQADIEQEEQEKEEAEEE